MIEACRHTKNAPKIPSDLESDYFVSLKELKKIVFSTLDEDLTEADYSILLGALAILNGKIKLGMAISELSDEPYCPECGESLELGGSELIVDEKIDCPLL